MYIKKILVIIAVAGLLFCGYKVYDIMGVFSAPNTAFNNQEAYIYIPSNADYNYNTDLFIILCLSLICLFSS